jgi:hypothetical protein
MSNTQNTTMEPESTTSEFDSHSGKASGAPTFGLSAEAALLPTDGGQNATCDDVTEQDDDGPIFARNALDTITYIDGVDYPAVHLADLRTTEAKITWLQDRVSDGCEEIKDTIGIGEDLSGIARELLQIARTGTAMTEMRSSEFDAKLEELDSYLLEQGARVGDLMSQANLDNEYYPEDRRRREALGVLRMVENIVNGLIEFLPSDCSVTPIVHRMCCLLAVRDPETEVLYELLNPIRLEMFTRRTAPDVVEQGDGLGIVSRQTRRGVRSSHRWGSAGAERHPPDSPRTRWLYSAVWKRSGCVV